MLCWKQVLEAKAWAKDVLKNSENDQLKEALRELFKLIDCWSCTGSVQIPHKTGRDIRQ